MLSLNLGSETEWKPEACKLSWDTTKCVVVCEDSDKVCRRVEAWIHELGLGHLVPIFRAHCLGGETLMQMT